MNNTPHYESKVAQLSILAGLLSLASIYLTAAGADFNTAVFSNPRLLLGMTTANVTMLKWSMIADMFGFYLLLLPALFYYFQYMKSRTAWSYLLSWCGSAYLLIGAIGAAILAVVWPNNIAEYPIATALQQELIMRNFDLVNQMVYGGMWNMLEVMLAGTWWLGLGIILKKEQPVFGTITVLLGMASIMDGVGNMTGLKLMAEAGLNAYLILGIVWPVWFGIQLINRNKQSSHKTGKKGSLTAYMEMAN